MSNNRTHVDAGIAEQFRALGNPHRLEIFLFLARNCLPGIATPDEQIPAYVGDLASRLTIAPSTVSHHLKELRQAGLIRMARRGQAVECWVERDTLERLSQFFGELASCTPRGC